MSEVNIPQADGAENAPPTKKPKSNAAVKNGSDAEPDPQVRVVRVTSSHAGGGRRDMSQCLFSLRNGGTYTAIYPHQELLEKGWEKVVVDAVYKNDVLEEYRIREAKPGENGPVLRQRPKERPRYEIPNRDIVTVVASSKQQRYPVEQPTFDKDGHCCIRVPLDWRVKLANGK